MTKKDVTANAVGWWNTSNFMNHYLKHKENSEENSEGGETASIPSPNHAAENIENRQDLNTRDMREDAQNQRVVSYANAHGNSIDTPTTVFDDCDNTTEENHNASESSTSRLSTYVPIEIQNVNSGPSHVESPHVPIEIQNVNSEPNHVESPHLDQDWSRLRDSSAAHDESHQTHYMLQALSVPYHTGDGQTGYPNDPMHPTAFSQNSPNVLLDL